MAPPLLLLFALLLVVTSCADSSPRSPFGRSSAALEPDLDPDIPPVAPVCPEPGDVPDPFPPDLPGSFTTPAAGTIAGSFSVSSSGEAVYSMALAVLPGRAGYDEVGNQIARPGATISYTAFDLPKAFTLDQVGAVTLDYDGNQQRIRKTTPTQEIIYAGDLYERVTDLATGAVEHRYIVHGPERAVAVVRPDASAPDRALYLHVDHLGSVEAITNEVGAVTELRSYDAFGARRDPADWSAPPPLPSPSTSSARLGFTGHEDDTELGLVNMRGRMYDPQLGRFLTPDPVVAHPGFSQSWNPYSYVLNGPLSYVDPTGFTEEEPEYTIEMVEVGVRAQAHLNPDGPWHETIITTFRVYEFFLVPIAPNAPAEGPQGRRGGGVRCLGRAAGHQHLGPQRRLDAAATGHDAGAASTAGRYRRGHRHRRRGRPW